MVDSRGECCFKETVDRFKLDSFNFLEMIRPQVLPDVIGIAAYSCAGPVTTDITPPIFYICIMS